MFLHFYIMHHFLEKVNSLFQFLLIFSDRERGEGLFSHCYAVVEQLAPYDAGGDGDTSFSERFPRDHRSTCLVFRISRNRDKRLHFRISAAENHQRPQCMELHFLDSARYGMPRDFRGFKREGIAEISVVR